MMSYETIIKAVNDHFGIDDKWKLFKLPLIGENEDEFLLFDKPIEIVLRHVAWTNIVERCGIEGAIEFSDPENIDYYRRLGHTKYFFRWL